MLSCFEFIEQDRAPIFTHTDSLFGRGIVGGPMFSSHEMADACAKVAVRLLNGETPGDIKIVPVGLAASGMIGDNFSAGTSARAACRREQNPVSGANGLAALFLANRADRRHSSRASWTYHGPATFASSASCGRSTVGAAYERTCPRRPLLHGWRADRLNCS